MLNSSSAVSGEPWMPCSQQIHSRFKDGSFFSFFPSSRQDRLKRSTQYHPPKGRVKIVLSTCTFLRLAGFLGQLRALAKTERRTFVGVIHKSIPLDHSCVLQFTDVAQVADAARNLEILRDRDDF
ncbi:hypothetical protein Tco_0222529 [Tanacetum coccineum]|uniref:Uncharacterized protein n=1 Tax=Tanacetum coccineum TaxID=301880 RepID=A0ABQ4X6B5_9ASTR